MSFLYIYFNFQKLPELSFDNTTVTVSSSNSTPDNSALRSVNFTGGSVDVGNTLTKVEERVLGSVYIFDFK